MIQHTFKNALSHYTFIDLFAGIGGFHLALSSFGAKCVFACDWDKDAQKVYEYNFKMPVHGNIVTIDENNIPKHDILCAGFPCQAFSISGKKLGFQDTRGTLFFDVARITKRHKPKVILLENVKNFATHDRGNTLKTVLDTLYSMGYKTFYDILNASDFGIPQSRSRIYIVAIKEEFSPHIFTLPQGTKEQVSLNDYIGDDQNNINKVIIDKPINWNIPKKIKVNQPNRIGTYNKGGQGERVYDPRGHAITLSAYGGGIGAKTGLYKINSVVRRLTPKECVRISGFPDSYQIAQSLNVAYKQFGNTVVVDVVQTIITKLIKEKIL